MLKKPYKLAIIDDQEDLLELLEDYIDSEYKDKVAVKTYKDPRQALDAIEKDEIDFVISDINMPEMYGDMLIKNIPRSIPVIIITGDSSLSIAHTCFRNGVEIILHKPFTREEFLKASELVIDKLDAWVEAFYAKKD